MLLDVCDPETNKLLLRYDPECRILELRVRDYDKSSGRRWYANKYINLSTLTVSNSPPATEVQTGDTSLVKTSVAIPLVAELTTCEYGEIGKHTTLKT